jgi:hypothetical protein
MLYYMVKKHKKSLKGGVPDEMAFNQLKVSIKNAKQKARNALNRGDVDEDEEAKLRNILQAADSLHDFDVKDGHGRASNAHDALVTLATVQNPGPAEDLLAKILGALSKSGRNIEGIHNVGKRDFGKKEVEKLCDLKPVKSLSYEWGVTALMDDCGFLNLEQGRGENLITNKGGFANQYGAGITWQTIIDSATDQNRLNGIIGKINECNVGNILVIHQGHATNARGERSGINWKGYREMMKKQSKTQTSIECRALRKVILSFLFPNIKVDEVGVGFTYDAGASQAKQPTNVIFEKASINSNNNNGDFIAVTPANMIDSAVAPRSYVPAGAVQGSPAHLKQKKTMGTLRKLRLALDAYNSTQKKFIFPSTDGAPDSITYKYSGETTFFSNKFGVEITLKDNGFGPNNPMGFDLNLWSRALAFTIPYHQISQMSILQGPSAPFLASMMWKKGENTINKKGNTKDQGFSNQIVGVKDWGPQPVEKLAEASKAKNAKMARRHVNEMWDALLFDFKRSGDYEQIEAMIHATKNPVEPFFGVLCTVDILAALRARQKGLPSMLVGTGPSDDKYLICYRPRKSNPPDDTRYENVPDPCEKAQPDSVSFLIGGNRGKIMKGGVMTQGQKRRAEISHIRGITSFVKNMVISKISTILSLPSNAELNAKKNQLNNYLNANTDTLQIKMAFQCYRIYYDILKNLDNYFNRVSTQSACVVDKDGRVSRDYNSIQIDVPDTRNFLIDMMNIKKQVKGFLSNGVTISYLTNPSAITNPLLQNYIFISLNLISSNPIPKSTRSQRKATIETYVQGILSPITTAGGGASFRAFFAEYSKNLWSSIIAHNWTDGTEAQDPLDAFNTKKLSDDFLDALKEMIAETLGISDAEQINTVDNKILGQIYQAVVALKPQQDILSQDMLFESMKSPAPNQMQQQPMQMHQHQQFGQQHQQHQQHQQFGQQHQQHQQHQQFGQQQQWQQQHQQHQQQDDDGAMEIENDLGGGAKKRVMHGGANHETGLLFTLCTWDNLFNLDFSPFEYFTASPSFLNSIPVVHCDSEQQQQQQQQQQQYCHQMMAGTDRVGFIFGTSWVLPNTGNTGNNTVTLDQLNDIFIEGMNATVNQLSATAPTKNIALSLAAGTTAQYPFNGPYLLNFPYTNPNINGDFLSTGWSKNTWPLVFPSQAPGFDSAAFLRAQGYCNDGVIVYFPRMGRTYLNNCELLTPGGTNEDRIKQQGILKYVLWGDNSQLGGGRKRKKKTRKRKKRKYKTLRRRKRNRKHSLKRKKRKRKTRFKK